MDIVVVFVGWAFLFYLNNRTLKRAEIQKLKDSSITFLEQLIKESKKAFKENQGKETPDEMASIELEELISRLVPQFELRANGLQVLSSFDGFNPVDIARELRDVDSEKILKEQGRLQNYHNQIDEIIDSMESSYFNKFYNRSLTDSLFLVGPRMYGLFVAATSLYMLFCVIREMYW